MGNPGKGGEVTYHRLGFLGMRKGTMKPATNTATQKIVMIGKATKRDVFSAIVFHCQAKNSVDQFRTLSFQTISDFSQ